MGATLQNQLSTAGHRLNIYQLVVAVLLILVFLISCIESNGENSGQEHLSVTDQGFGSTTTLPTTTTTITTTTTTITSLVDLLLDTTTVSSDELSTSGTPTTVATPTTIQPVTVPNQSTEEPQSGGSSSTPKPNKCVDDNYCLNGGTCVLSPSGQMLCLCPDGFYGARCQTRNICQTVITASLTGDQICSKIDRECYKNDKFFRCSCHNDEYFLFKINQTPQANTNKDPSPSSTANTEKLNYSARKTLIDAITIERVARDSLKRTKSPNADRSPFEYRQTSETTSGPPKNQPSYLAECRKIDKCLGIRCRRMSEVCSEGECICNRDSGYSRDPKSGLCKLLNPCLIPTEDGSPICGQAKCVATYDHDLYRCVCPVAYKALKVGAHRNSTQCVPINYFTICDVPLLNKCQHTCRIDRIQNHYKCSCLPGYRPGVREGFDDHLCFFDEHVAEHSYRDKSNDGRDATSDQQLPDRLPPHLDIVANPDYVYRSYSTIKQAQNINSQSSSGRLLDSTFAYDPLTTVDPLEQVEEDTKLPFIDERESGPEKLKSKDEIHIKREHRKAHDPTRQGSSLEDEDKAFININRMSAQERCNMFCEENKICVLEEGSVDSYRCVCDRQGYVSIGDRCLDWCAAAEFSYRVRALLDAVCLSGVCEPTLKTNQQVSARTEDEIVKLERETSWRPSFQCDCTSSPLLKQDQDTKLCKLDFEAILEPCLPGNVGYIDCVENKNAYCAVLYRQHWSFIRDLQKERPNDSGIKTPDPDSSKANSDRPKFKAKDKLYTCVCSPEKKFLVDKPRNKARCVDECELLNVECGRFNRMCRPATIAPDDFGRQSLVRMDPDGVRMNFKRTGCECLPGFNVGPFESLDFTLDDNNPSNNALTLNPLTDENYPQITPMLQNANDIGEETEHFRAKYMNINSRCLLDYDVVEFHASFKAPSDFDPTWVKINNPVQISIPAQKPVPQNPPTSGTPTIDDKSNAVSAKNLDDSVISASSNGSRNSETGSKDEMNNLILEMPQFMKTHISEFHKNIVLVAQCDDTLAPLSLEVYQECIRYRYWIVQKLRNHFVDWRKVVTSHLSETFDLMEGNIKLHVNKCEATLKSVTTGKQTNNTITSSSSPKKRPTHGKASNTKRDYEVIHEDPSDEQALVDADIDCELTLHSASDESAPRYSRKVLLEKQLQKFIFMKPADRLGDQYYLMAPKTLIRRESFDQLAEHRRLFNPCKSDYSYCDKQTKCDMVDTVNFTCTCEYGYTPIGSRDIYYGDSRKEVCEDINECLFDVCKELANVSTCINEIGDYRCQCNRHYTGDNKRFCTHVCNTIPCKHGRCRLVDDHHAFCECEDGYKETDCSVQDPNVALRKANMIICGSIFTSVLLLAITFAISLNSQLKKTKKKLKKLENFDDATRMIEFNHQSPFRSRVSSKVFEQ